jgi:hypothetical protein
MSESTLKDDKGLLKDIKSALYGRAATALRKAHEDEFRALLEAEYTKEGLEYRPRRSAAERAAEEDAKAKAKAAAKIKALVEQYGPDVVPDALGQVQQSTAEAVSF